MSEIGSYYLSVGVRGVEGINGAFGRVKSGLSSLASGATAPIKRLGGSLMGLFNPLTLIGAAAGAAGVYGARGILSLASETENLSTQFRVLLGSADAAAAMMREIEQFSASTPFEQMELADAAKKLLATGSAAGNVVGEMRQLGDIAALSSATIGDLVSIYGKVRGQGKLTAETINQFVERGIPLVRQLAQQFGVTEAEIRKMTTEGKIGFADVQKAIAGLTGEGGQFAGGMAELAKTTGGLWSTVTGNFKTLVAQFGGAFIEALRIKEILAGLGTWLGDAASGFQENFQPAIAWMREAVGGMVDWIAGRFSAMTAWLKRMWAEWGDLAWQYVQTATAAIRAYFEIYMAIYSAIAEAFATVLGFMAETLWGWIGASTEAMKTGAMSWLESMEFWATNWKLYLQIGWEEFKRFAMNVPAYFKAAAVNLVNLVVWFGENWRDILYTSVDWVLTVFVNLGKNIRAVWQGVLDFFSGKGFSVDWTPLTEGFHSSIKKMPAMVEAEVHATTPELNKLYKELDKRREAFYAKKRAKGETVVAEEGKSPDLPGAPGPGETPAAAASKAGKQSFSFTGIAELAKAMQTEAGKREQDAAKAARETADGVGRLAGAADGGALNVRVIASPAPVWG